MPNLFKMIYAADWTASIFLFWGLTLSMPRNVSKGNWGLTVFQSHVTYNERENSYDALEFYKISVLGCSFRIVISLEFWPSKTLLKGAGPVLTVGYCQPCKLRFQQVGVHSKLLFLLNGCQKQKVTSCGVKTHELVFNRPHASDDPLEWHRNLFYLQKGPP